MNQIHPTALIGEHVRLGKNITIGAYSVFRGHTYIGDYCDVGDFASIGANAEHHEFFEKEGELYISDGCRIREFVTINAGSNKMTHIGKNCVFLKGSHVGHDSRIEDDCTISCNALIGGHSYLMRGCNIGLGAILHQYSVVGSYCMIGMGTICTKKSDLIPGTIYVGNPAYRLSANTVGLHKNGISPDSLRFEIERFWSLQK